MTKLYDIPRNTKVRILDSEPRIPPNAITFTEGEVITFGHIDGMYSFCHKEDGTVCHLAAWTEVEIVDE